VAPPAGAAAVLSPALAQPVGPALYPQRAALHQRGGELGPCAVVYLLRRGPRDAHVFAALGLGAALIIYEPDGLVFLDRHEHGLDLPAAAGGPELTAARQAADSSALFGTRHFLTSFLAYAGFEFECITIFGICQ